LLLVAGNQTGIVVDGWGAVAGLLTLEMIMERIQAR
jgi:Mg2+/Co2+ transporter CorC